MVIIQDFGTWWIEGISVARFSVGNNSVLQTNVPLAKAGLFMGCSASQDPDVVGELQATNTAISITNADDSALVIGQAISALTLNRYNNRNANQTFGAQIIVFMRSAGSV